MGATVHDQKRIHLTGTPNVTVRTFNGSLEVRAWDRNEILVDIEKRARTIEDAREIRVETSEDNGDVVIAALSSLRKGGVVAINAIHLDRIPEFDYDRLLWGERQVRSVANMTRADARDFLQIAAEIDLRPKVTAFPLEHANEALLALKSDSIDGAAVITL